MKNILDAIEDLHREVLELRREIRRRKVRAKGAGRPPLRKEGCMRAIQKIFYDEGKNKLSVRRVKALLYERAYSRSTINAARIALGIKVTREDEVWYWIHPVRHKLEVVRADKL